jgi:adenylate cyclase
MSKLTDLIRGDEPPKVYLPEWMDRLAAQGIVSQDPQVIRRQRLTNIFTYFSIFNAASNILLVSLQEFRAFLPAHAAIALMIVMALQIPRLHRISDNLGAHAVAGIDIFGTLLLAFSYGRDSQIYLYYTLTAVLLLVFGIENWRRYAPWFVLAAASLLVSLTLAPSEGLFATQNHRLREIIAMQTIFNALLVMSTVIFFAVANLRRAEIELEGQHARAKLLVDTVFPPSIVVRLTSGEEERVADRIDGLTVLFADLVGFTNAARDLPPEAVIDYLDDMVRAFDTLCATHGVEKIKTIGDCYMAVGGLNGDVQAQAIAIGKFAQDVVRFQATRPPLGGRKLPLRVGIHTGSATAGIIGDTRFTYDVWGDAVNVASRMESHGLPNRVQVSQAWCATAGDAFVIEPRGVIDIRSLGPTRTFLLAEGAEPRRSDSHVLEARDGGA